MALVGPTKDGQSVTIGLPEIASSVAMKSAACTVTLAMKGGVTNDFILRTALGVKNQLEPDLYALVPVMEIVCTTLALTCGAEVIVQDSGELKLVGIEECPGWLQQYFSDGR